jgi:hypothetical protein
MQRRSLIRILSLAPCCCLPGCGETPDATQPPSPVPIVADNECHVCGMLIKRFPGPKAEAYVQGRALPYKFCSTRDLFAWLRQPETAAVVRDVYVHDMGAPIGMPPPTGRSPTPAAPGMWWAPMPRALWDRRWPRFASGGRRKRSSLDMGAGSWPSPP